MEIKRITKLKTMKNKRIAFALSLLTICLGLSGCVNLPPWERGILAKPHMAIIQNPVQNKARAHIYSSREAGAPVNSLGGGGGCGCF